MERGLAFLRALGLDAALAPASDPFFGQGARFLAASQRAQSLKFELLAPIGSAATRAALVSCNYHLDHFGELFAVRTGGGEVAHSACVGFGMERIALALLTAHGADPRRWPPAVRAMLWWEAAERGGRG
jgi:seryl-tRNA synthetase